MTPSSLYRGGLLDSECVEVRLAASFLTMDTEPPWAGQVILRPHGPAQTEKVIDAGVARLLRAARQGNQISVSVAEGWARSDVAAAVLDGMVSLRHGPRWMHGVDALHEIFPALDEPSADCGVLGQMSDRALAAGALYAGERRLADYLYSYGRLPVGEGELAKLPNREAVTRWLGIEPAPDWLRPWRQRDPQSAGWWHMWHLRDASEDVAPDQPMPKLYVSPHPNDLPDALRELCVTAAELGIPTVKVGSDAHAVYRPDKLVAYAVDLAQLDALATRLLPRLSGALSHGVPFTAERSEDGIVSWGMDPPLGGVGAVRMSWRQSCSAVAADGLNRAADHDVSTAMKMARAWLWVNDIDPRTWSPVSP
jgi:hypothetical protein